MTATILPIPDDPRLWALIEDWPEFQQAVSDPFPRSLWLGAFERILRGFYPQANSASLKLTARHAAPFPLRAGKDVP